MLWITLKHNINFHFPRRLSKQEEVNYAVSEREDGITGVTTLMRMTGSTGLQFSCTELFCTVLDCTGLCWAVLGCVGLYWAVMGCTGL